DLEQTAVRIAAATGAADVDAGMSRLTERSALCPGVDAARGQDAARWGGELETVGVAGGPACSTDRQIGRRAGARDPGVAAVELAGQSTADVVPTVAEHHDVGVRAGRDSRTAACEGHGDHRDDRSHARADPSTHDQRLP